MIETLIIEDDPMVSQINENYLSKLPSFSIVGTATNGRKAFQKIKEIKPHLILLDVYMPEINGIELLRKLRAENFDIDVILITAAAESEIIEEAMRLGVVDCILKPFSFERFQSALSYYEKRRSIFNTSKINQSVLDSLQLPNSFQEDELPKGIDPVTLETIIEKMKEAYEPLSIDDLASLVSLSALTVRKYIEYLDQCNKIKLDLKYSKRGRPAKLYSLQ